jgi:hypothetical protein
MNKIERAREYIMPYRVFQLYNEHDNYQVYKAEIVDNRLKLYEQALSEQRGEIIDSVVKIANENRNYKWSFDEFIKEIEKLREVK